MYVKNYIDKLLITSEIFWFFFITKLSENVVI